MSYEKQKYQPKTGTVVSVGALWTKKSCGCGEYLDLIPFANFCKKAGLSIIQILPVNDTGTESSPYSALSAFALHPLYISLSALPEVALSDNIRSYVSLMKDKYKKYSRFPYAQLRKEKLSILKTVYAEYKDEILSSQEMILWIQNNEWIKVYAVFSYYKTKNLESSWKQWKSFKNPSLTEIEEVWNDPSFKNELGFYAWVQMRADQQFLKAADYIKSQDLTLKGDIPIMMNEDSSDAWAYPQFFIQSLRAGSPPDASNPLGQNWGFPIYNWETLAQDDYSWWKKRLLLSSRYYGMFRIDHVLGFFRIWAIPERETTACLGWPLPYKPITKKELTAAGFSDDQIRWLSLSHVPTRSIEEVNNFDYLGTHGIMSKIMDRIGDEELWVFKPSIQGDRDILESDIPHPVKEKLAQLWLDRCLVQTKKNTFSPVWRYEDSTSWKSFDNEKKEALKNLIDDKKKSMEKLWQKQAETLLGELHSVGNMTSCAEDLGANPESVPRVLESLGIYGLRVIRWNRLWSVPSQPFVPFNEYPALSVATSSVHDSSTLRLWWLTEGDAEDFYKTFPPSQEVSRDSFTPNTARYLLTSIAKAHSELVIHPVQDFLALKNEYYNKDPQAERINIPGSVNEFNWTYKLPVSLEHLCEDEELHKEIRKIADEHTRTQL